MASSGAANRKPRGAVKVNPVTGKLEKAEVKEGMHRDGMLQLSDRYINAAKEAGLGDPGGMYSHMLGLKRMGAADIPYGTSIEKKGTNYKSGYESSNTATGRKSTIKTGVQGTSKRSSTQAKDGKGQTSFSRFKGVVNTIGGSHDVTRGNNARLPAKKDRTGGARVMTFSSMAAEEGGPGTGQLSRASQKRQERNRAPAPLCSSTASSSNAENQTKTNTKGPTSGKSISKSSNVSAHNASQSGTTRNTSITRKLGGGATSGGASTAQTDREKRAAFFEAKFAANKAS